MAESKLVQEIAAKSDEIPEKYIQKDGYPAAIDAPDLWRDTLVIDFSLLSSSPKELAKLRTALSEWGCFQVINHGIESSFLEDLIEVTKQFFELPLEEKLKYSSGNEIYQGYASDATRAGNQVSNWNDRLYLTLYPEEKRQLNFWPTKPDSFKGMIDEYSKKLAAIIDDMCKAMARSLNLEEECFLRHEGKQGSLSARFNFYPRCACPENVLGIKPHSDGTFITILLPEKEVEGLQIMKDDVWYQVPVIPAALFVNLGDFGEVMSNGEFKSVVHRAVTNAKKDRISVAAYRIPGQGSEIGPISELINNHKPQLYKRFNIDQFGKIYFESHAKGRQSIEALKLQE